jgi:hypothetical protein
VQTYFYVIIHGDLYGCWSRRSSDLREEKNASAFFDIILLIRPERGECCKLSDLRQEKGCVLLQNASAFFDIILLIRPERGRMPQVIRLAAGEGLCPSPERVSVLRHDTLITPERAEPQETRYEKKIPHLIRDVAEEVLKDYLLLRIIRKETIRVFPCDKLF